VTVEEMAAFDQVAIASSSQEVLVRRAGMAVGFAALDLMGGVTGRRVGVIAGPGANGSDGRVAAAMLQRRGAHIRIVGPDAGPGELADVDLVIDAAFGTGLSRGYLPPKIPEAVPVIAVDLPSGLDGDTGALLGAPLRADLTVTMASIKAGLLLGSGPDLVGRLVVADVGIPTSPSSGALVEDVDLAAIPPRARIANKWSSAVCVVAGSAGMEGAAVLCSVGALRAGAGMVRLVTPSMGGRGPSWPTDVVRHEVSPGELIETVRSVSSRCAAIVIGPGLGLDDEMQGAIREIVATRTCATVLDADGITAATDQDTLRGLAGSSAAPLLITPHDGELRRLLGHELGPDRVGTLRSLAEEARVTVLSKGATTLVVAPSAIDPVVRFVTAGTEALATAGTGDVLGGVIAALCARGVDLPRAAALGAHLHGRAGAKAPGTMVASDLPRLVGEVLREVAS
jgi:NAD(P)H-hydrate epimerase